MTAHEQLVEVFLSPEVSVQPAGRGYDVVIEPVSSREAVRRIGTFTDLNVALTWAKVMVAERKRRKMR